MRRAAVSRLRPCEGLLPRVGRPPRWDLTFGENALAAELTIKDFPSRTLEREPACEVHVKLRGDLVPQWRFPYFPSCIIHSHSGAKGSRKMMAMVVIRKAKRAARTMGRRAGAATQAVEMSMCQ
jgi:hypothetical protein